MPDSKSGFRRLAAAGRDGLSLAYRRHAGEMCMENVFLLPEYQDRERIYCYVSFRSEMPTEKLIEEALAQGKKVAVPRIQEGEMAFYDIRSLADCRPGCMGIREPVTNCSPVWEPGLALVPGLAFDKDLYRLGYGGGFYDRFLEENPQILPVGIAFECQRYDRIPRMSHDRQMAGLVTESAVYRIR